MGPAELKVGFWFANDPAGQRLAVRGESRREGVVLGVSAVARQVHCRGFAAVVARGDGDLQIRLISI